MSEVPIPRPSTSERTASSPMNEKASATLRSGDEGRQEQQADDRQRQQAVGEGGRLGEGDATGEVRALSNLGKHGDRHHLAIQS
jgi:hypothetical protein